VLWTDCFKPPHFEKYPQLHTLFNEATKLAGASGTKGSADPAAAGSKRPELSGAIRTTRRWPAGCRPACAGATPAPATAACWPPGAADAPASAADAGNAGAAPGLKLHDQYGGPSQPAH